MVMSYLFVLHDSVFLTTTEESIFCCLLCDQTTTQPALLYLTTIDVGFDGVLGEPAQGAIPPSKTLIVLIRTFTYKLPPLALLRKIRSSFPCRMECFSFSFQRGPFH